MRVMTRTQRGQALDATPGPANAQSPEVRPAPSYGLKTSVAEASRLLAGRQHRLCIMYLSRITVYTFTNYS